MDIRQLPAPSRLNWVVIFCVAVICCGVVRAAEPAGDWPAPVQGFVPPAPGEHPRLLFRKGDVAALRKRAQTPEGQAIVKRLRVLLNGSDGESFPTVFNGSGKAYGGNTPAKKDAGDDKRDDAKTVA